jgi:hypothetical protein
VGLPSPVVVCDSYEYCWAFNGGLKNWPDQKLLVANENGGFLVTDFNGSWPGEPQGYALIRAKRIPHTDRHWDSLRERSRCLRSDDNSSIVILPKALNR